MLKNAESLSTRKAALQAARGMLRPCLPGGELLGEVHCKRIVKAPSSPTYGNSADCPPFFQVLAKYLHPHLRSPNPLHVASLKDLVTLM